MHFLVPSAQTFAALFQQHATLCEFVIDPPGHASAASEVELEVRNEQQNFPSSTGNGWLDTGHSRLGVAEEEKG